MQYATYYLKQVLLKSSKALQMSLYFFLFLFLVSVSETDWQTFFLANNLLFVTQKTCGRNQVHFIGHTGKIFC